MPIRAPVLVIESEMRVQMKTQKERLMKAIRISKYKIPRSLILRPIKLM